MCEYCFRQMKEGEFERLRPVWKKGFGDSDELIDSFCDRMLHTQDVQLALCCGEPVAMAVLLPTVLCTQDGAEKSAGCIYALTTLPEQRGKGIAARLIGSVVDRRRADGVKSIAISPDGPGLFQYYAEQGWRNAFSVREIEVSAEGAAARAVSVGAGAYTVLREKLLEGRDHIRWDERAVGFQEWICRDSGGGLFTFQAAEPCCAAVEYDEGGRLLACELLAPDELLLPCAAGLLEYFSEKRIQLRMPAWLGEKLGGQVLPFGMLLPEGKTPSPRFCRLTARPMAYMGFDFC